MAEPIEIRLVLAPSLVEYFEEGMRKRHLESDATEELIEFLADILNDTLYPIASRRSAPEEITISYRQRPFADPIF